jgi:L-fuculose-phosphate aldolase
MVHIAKLAYARGLVFGVGGNISVRAGERILITPKGACLRNVKAEELVTSDLTGKTTGKKEPSIELPMHLAIYRTFPSVNAVIHAHSPFATAWSTLRISLKSRTVEGRFILGKVPVVGYAEPGTTKLAEAVCEKLREGKAVLLHNHGLVAVGSTLDEAFNLAETVEETAKIEVLAAILKHRL